MRLVILLLCAGWVAWTAAPPRAWTAYPPIVEREAPSTIYAIGDIHGDSERLVRLLDAAGIVARGKVGLDQTGWIAGDSVLVVTGDMIDKGPHPVAVLQLLRGLQKTAHRQGGEVLVLAGNHEAEFLTATNAAKNAEFAGDLRKSGAAAGDVAACHAELGEFLCSLPYGARVGDWFFSHGGNTGGQTIAELATKIRNGSYALTGPDSLLEARLGGAKKWFATSNAAISEEQLLRSYAAKLGVNHMVQGHQHNNVRFSDGVERHTGEMFQCWGLLFLIDVGMSREVGDSQGAVLRITRTGATAVCADGSTTLLWDATAKADRGTAAPCLK